MILRSQYNFELNPTFGIQDCLKDYGFTKHGVQHERLFFDDGKTIHPSIANLDQ